ncbi:hypothetical protein OSTOST_17574, partial [Ostertagia ostertagi]
MATLHHLMRPLSPNPEVAIESIADLLANGAIKQWRSEGKGVAIYLDDGLIWASCRNECNELSQSVRKDLKDFGWFEAKEKSNWDPHSKFRDLDLTERIERASSILQRMLREKAPSLLTRMRWEGSLASMNLVISDKDKRRTRAMTTAIAEAQSSEFSLSYRWSLSALEKRDIVFWVDRLKSVN